MRCYLRGRERWWKVGAKSSARVFYEKIKTEERERRLKLDAYRRRRDVTLGAWVDRYVASCTLRSVKDQKRRGRWWKKVLGRRLLTDITSEELTRLQAVLLQKGRKAPATINRYFAFLKHLFFLAMRDGLVERNPVSGVRFLPESAGRLRFLTLGEEARLRETLGGLHWPLVAFSLHTGLRQAEQFNLRWEQVDMENRIITIPRSKSGETRHVPINQTALGILRGLTSWMTSPSVFPSEKPGSPVDARNFYRRVFLPAVRQAKLDGVCWHTLRHTFASRLVMAGVDLRSVQELLGHHSLAMVMRYTHLSPGHLQEAVGRLVASPAQAQNRNVTVTKTVTEPDGVAVRNA